MKKLLIIVASVLVLLVAAAFIAPKVMDWNGYKADVAKAVKDATGRDLVIEGDVEVSLLPTPSFSASGIRFSNAPGASEPDMARMESIEVSVALFPLITGEIQVQSIVLNQPVIALEKLSDGSTNWELGGAGSGEASGEGGVPAISLDDVQINNGTIIYRDATSGKEQRIEALTAQLSAGSLAGPYKLDGSAKLRDLAMTLKIDVAGPDAAGAMPVALTLGLPDSGAEATLEGSYGADAFTGTLALKGSNLAAALAQLSGGGDQPDLLQAPFSFQSALKASPSEVSLPDIVLGLGEDQGSGSLLLTLQPAMTLNAALKMERLDLDRILAAAAPSADTAVVDGGETAAGPLFPAGMTGGIALDIGTVIYRGEELQGLKLAAQLADAVLTLEEAKAMLPGGSDFRLLGALQDSSEGPSFAGAVELISDDPRTLARWAGADVSAVPEGKLQSFSLVSQLSLAGQQLSFTGTEIAFDETNASGGLTLVLAQKPAFGLGLVVDKIDLDAYLPPAGGDDSSGGDPFVFLSAFDANLDIKVGEAIYRGDRLKNIRLDATVANGAVTFRQASVGDVAGSSFSYSGSLAAGPSVNGQLTANVADAAALSGLLGEETTGALAPLGPFIFDAKLGGTAAKMDLDGVLEAKGGRFAAKGSIDQAGGPAFDLELAVRHPDLPALLTALGSDGGSLPPALSSIDLAGHFKGTPKQITASQLSGSLGEIALSGGFTLDLSGKPTIAADLSTGDIDLARFSSGGSEGGSGERWSREPIDLSALGLVDGTVKIAAASVTDGELRLNNAIIDAVLTAGVLNINRLAGEIYGGQLELTGQVDGRATPIITAAFSIANLDLGEYLKTMVPVGIPLGRISAQGQITSVGASEADLIAALNGALTADGLFRLDTGGVGAIAGIGGKALGQVAEGLLGIGGKQVSNIADAGSLLLAALADYDTPLTARISIQDGKALIEQAELKPRGMTALASGVADLLPFVGDINLAVFLNDNPDEPYYLEQRSGLLDDPDILRSGLVTSGGAKQDLPELTELDPSQIPAQVVEQLIPSGVEELVPGGGADLLGGLLGTGESEAPTPVIIEEQPADVVEEPAPEVVEEATPVVVEEQPAEVVEEQPAQVVEEPAPVVVEEPAPVVVEEPAPEVVEEPAPEVVEEQPAQVVEEPAPVVVEEPAPEVAEAPAEEPAPAAAPELGPVLPAILEQVFGP